MTRHLPHIGYTNVSERINKFPAGALVDSNQPLAYVSSMSQTNIHARVVSKIDHFAESHTHAHEPGPEHTHTNVGHSILRANLVRTRPGRTSRACGCRLLSFNELICKVQSIVRTWLWLCAMRIMQSNYKRIHTRRRTHAHINTSTVL